MKAEIVRAVSLKDGSLHVGYIIVHRVSVRPLGAQEAGYMLCRCCALRSLLLQFGIDSARMWPCFASLHPRLPMAHINRTVSDPICMPGKTRVERGRSVLKLTRRTLE